MIKNIKINGKSFEIGAAEKEHTHKAEDIGAAPKKHTHTAEEVGAAKTEHLHNEYAPKEHTHTFSAADVGAAAEKHSHSANDVSGIPQVVTGTYTGELITDGNQFINLGKTPKAVYVTRQGYANNKSGYPYGGLALNGTPSYNILSSEDGIAVNTLKVLEIVDNGFRAYYASNGMVYAAKKGNLYSYIAWF